MKLLIMLCAAIITFSLQTVQAQELNDDTAADALYTTDELEELVAPIALYPDPLIAQILPASTFIDQIHEAAILVRRYGNAAAIDSQAWDVSIKAIAHYPDVLFMMDEDPDWTISLGEAFVNQQAEVMNAVQVLRAEARSVGNLVSTSQLQVVEDSGYIKIYPADPARIYIPVYDPQVVYYVPAYPSYSLISFGIGFSIGAWLNRDCDWYGRRIYYHGWRGGGWIHRSRPHVRIHNTVYVNNRHRNIGINTRLRYDGRYRNQIRQVPGYRRQLPGRSVPGTRPGTPVYRSRTPRGTTYEIRQDKPGQRSGAIGVRRGVPSGQRGGVGSREIRPRQNLNSTVPKGAAPPVGTITPRTKILPHQVPVSPPSTLPRQAPLPRQVPLPSPVPDQLPAISGERQISPPVIPRTPGGMDRGGSVGGRQR